MKLHKYFIKGGLRDLVCIQKEWGENVIIILEMLCWEIANRQLYKMLIRLMEARLVYG